MASKGLEMGLVLVLVAMLWGGATAQSGCTNTLVGLAPCLNYVTGNTTTPSSACCSQLASVVQSKPQCLCTLVNGGGSSLGVNINQTLALGLPAACKVQTPPVSLCNAASGPTSSGTNPATNPAANPPKPTNAPSGTGSKAVPGTSGSSSNKNISNLQLYLTFGFLLITACTSNVFTSF